MQKYFCLRMRKAFRGGAKGYLRDAKLGLRAGGGVQHRGTLPYEALGLIPSTEKGGREGGKNERRKTVVRYEGHSLRGVRIHFGSKENKCLGRKEGAGICVTK